MDGNKKMISLHEQKFPDLDVFQVNTSARLKNVQAQIGHLVHVTPQKYPRIFIIILLYIMGMN